MCSHSPVRQAVIKELASDKEFVRDYNGEQTQRGSQGAGVTAIGATGRDGEFETRRYPEATQRDYYVRDAWRKR